MRCRKDDFVKVHQVVANPDQPQNFTIDKYQITENGIKWYNLWTKINGLPTPIVPDKSKNMRGKAVIANGHSNFKSSGTTNQLNNELDIAFGDAQNKQNMLVSVIQTLRDYKAEYNLTIKELADKCGLGYYHLKELLTSVNDTNKKIPRLSDEKLQKLSHWIKLNKGFKRTKFSDLADTPDGCNKKLNEIIDYYNGITKIAKLFGCSPNAIYATQKKLIFSKKMRRNINKYHIAMPLDKSIPPPEAQPEPEPEQQELDLETPEVKEELEIIKHYPDPAPAPELAVPTHLEPPPAQKNGNGSYNIEIVQGYLLKDLIITRNKLEKANAELTELRVENRVLQELLKKKIDSYTA